MKFTYGEDKSRKYSYEWEEYEDGGKNAGTIITEILEDPKLPELEEVIVGCWGESWDNNAQPIIDGIVSNKDKFSHIKSLFIGDMEYEECEVSWIEQADYSKLWEALPQLEKLTIKGSTNLVLGDIDHKNLKSLEIICGGLPRQVLQSIGEAKMPNLLLYIGVEDYGFDGDISDIENMLTKSDFPKLEVLGIMDSEIQDEITEVVVKSKYMKQIEELNLSMGSLTDQGGGILLQELPSCATIRYVDLEYHYMSDEMMEKLTELPIEINVDDQQEEDEYDGEIYRYPMLTE